MGQEPRRSPWPLVVAVLGVTLLVVGATSYLAERVLSVPREVAGEGRALVRGLGSLAQAFRQGTLTTTFATTASALSGTSYLQFATLRQMEVFERRDSASLFWGQLDLPDVVVEARAPVEYTYFVDLRKRWVFVLRGDTVEVTAPGIEFNTPAVDASGIRYVVREGSVFRDEAASLAGLKAGLTALCRERARNNMALVRETGRKQAREFVEGWLVRHYFDARAHRVVLRFADEGPGPLRSSPAGGG